MVSTGTRGRGAQRLAPGGLLGVLASVAWAALGCDPGAPSALAGSGSFASQPHATAGATESEGSSDIDRAALVALYNATNGYEWEHDGEWLTDAPLGEWHGVDVDVAGHVVRLDLSSNGLSGRIPVEIGNLSALRFLGLSGNKLTGPLPLQLTELVYLDTLNLKRNELTGPVPAELARISNLRSLLLGFNQFTGRMPVELADLAELEILNIKRNQMEGPIPPELGNLSKLEVIDFAGAGFSGPIPSELGNLVNLRVLRLRHNRLDGPVPQSLGGASRLQKLMVNGNALTGVVPTTMLGVSSLTELHWGGRGDLCVPGTGRFLTWLAPLESSSGPMCGAEDVGLLDALYDSTSIQLWTSSRGWFDPGLPIDRHGVTTDTFGRVVSIDLSGNGLVGVLPDALGRLKSLRVLRLSDNTLVGELPATLVDVPLRELSYNRTHLCVPSDDDAVGFSSWLRTLDVHEASGVICEEYLDRIALWSLYSLTEGRSWKNSRNWLSPLPIAEWFGVETNADGRVVGLRLGGVGLTGPVPRLLGDLSELRTLNLSGNRLSGPIPPELGRLTQLEVLNLRWQIPGKTDTQITGPLPDELGDMANLRSVRLDHNNIDGVIPRTLGNLARLERLDISENDLSGSIPSELGHARSLKELRLGNNGLRGRLPGTLGDLADLKVVDLADNILTGALPPELGRLANLKELRVSGNRLAGPVPPEFKGLTSLEKLYLARNADMSGPLSAELLSLRLDELLLGGTGLCAPRYAAFAEWLANMSHSYIPLCEPESEPGSIARAYLVQAVQTHLHPVPLIAGRKALLRVFLETGDRARDDGTRNAQSPVWPWARATFFLDGAEVHATGPFSAQAKLVPATIVEHDISLSANIEVPGAIIQPGLTMTVDFDFADDSWLCCKRIPQQGRQSVDVRVAPPLHLTVLPMLQQPQPDYSILDAAASMQDDDSELLADLHVLTPVGRTVVDVREPVWTSSREPVSMLREIEAIRIVEGDRPGHHYLGLINLSTNVGGLAYIPGKSTLSSPDPFIIAHEVMHNFAIWHAPCLKSGIEPGYPHVDGTIGSVGYDFRTGALIGPDAFDLMGNVTICKPRWVSPYNFKLALRHRLAMAPSPRPAVAGGRTPAFQGRERSLLLWGGTTSDGAPFLEPAFVVNAPTSMSADGLVGAYRIVGTAADGRPLFSFRFDMQEVADADGEAGFAFAVPARPEYGDALAALTLTGPGGSTTISQGYGGTTAVLLRDARTGQVKGILRDASEKPELDPGVQVRVSRGIPSPASWRR